MRVSTPLCVRQCDDKVPPRRVNVRGRGRHRQDGDDVRSMPRIGSYHNPDPEIEFAKRCAPPDANDCIVWHGQIATNGYGRFARYGSTVPAHRYAYERKGSRQCRTCRLDRQRERTARLRCSA